VAGSPAKKSPCPTWIAGVAKGPKSGQKWGMPFETMTWQEHPPGFHGCPGLMKTFRLHGQANKRVFLIWIARRGPNRTWIHNLVILSQTIVGRDDPLPFHVCSGIRKSFDFIVTPGVVHSQFQLHGKFPTVRWSIICGLYCEQ
jgi:hypothetical protein